MAAFWDIALCSHMAINRRFRGAYCLHNQGDEYYVYKLRYLSLCISILNRLIHSSVFHVGLGPCHHGIASFRAANGGGGLETNL
jgi:hypothetical protein